MKKLLMCGAAAIVLASCGQSDNSEEINAALDSMALMQSGEGRTEFSDREISGDKVVFKNVVIRGSELAEEMEAALESEFDDEDDDLEVEFDGSDIMADELIFTGLKLSEAGTAQFSNMLLNKLTFVDEENEESDVTAASIELDNPTPELAAYVSGLLGKAEKVEPPTPDVIGFDAFTIMNFVAKDTEDETSQISFGKLEMTDLRDFKVGEFLIDSVNLDFIDPETGNVGKMQLGSMSVSGADVKFIQAFEEEDEDAMAAKFTELAYANPIDPGFDKFTLDSFTMDMAGVSFDLPEMAYNISRNKDGVPVKFDVPKFSMTLGADDSAGELGMQLAPVLAAIGLDEIKMTMASKSTYDPETDIAESETGYIQVDKAFKLTSGSKIGGLSKLGEAMQKLDPEAFAEGDQDPSATMMEIYSELDFYNFSLAVEDQGIVDKAFMLIAAQQGMEPAQLKNQVVGMVAGLPFFANAAGVDMEIATEFATAAQTFLQDGGTLTVSLDPEEPITVPALAADPSAITKEKLGFSAKTE